MLEKDLETPDRALGAEPGMLSGAEPLAEAPADVPDSGSFGGGYSPGSMLAARPPAVADAPSRDIMADVGYDPAKTAAVGQQLAGRLGEKMQADSYVDRMGLRRMEEDRGKMAAAYEATGAAKSAMPPPWEADKEREKRMRGPIEQFGSIGSVFAMMAGAFTRTPMIAALNAGAAAMTSMQAHDEKGYESAYAAWKDNTQLALKRFDMERAQFTDANTLMSSDMNAWKAKRFAIAAHYEDTKAFTLLENGMYPELLEMDAKKIHSARELQQTVAGWEEFENQRQAIKMGIQTWQQANPDKVGTFEDFKNRVQVLHDVKNAQRGLSAGRTGRVSAEQSFTEKFWAENPTATSDDFSEAFGEFRKNQKNEKGATDSKNPAWKYNEKRVPELMAERGISETEAMRVAKDEYRVTLAKEGTEAAYVAHRSPELQRPVDEGGEGLSKTAADRKAVSEHAADKRAPAVVTQKRDIANEVKTYKDGLRKEKNEDGSPKYTDRQVADMGAQRNKELDAESSGPGGNQRDKLAGMIIRYDASIEVIGKIENLLRKHGALTGLGGKITRPMEVVSNWFQSNETDRADFQRYIEKLREWGPRLLNESGGRPLASEAARINKIVRGLEGGDTTQNTASALKDLLDTFKEFREGAAKRIEGTWSPRTTTTKPGSSWNWESLPEVRGQ